MLGMPLGDCDCVPVRLLLCVWEFVGVPDLVPLAVMERVCVGVAVGVRPDVTVIVGD